MLGCCRADAPYKERRFPAVTCLKVQTTQFSVFSGELLPICRVVPLNEGFIGKVGPRARPEKSPTAFLLQTAVLGQLFLSNLFLQSQHPPGMFLDLPPMEAPGNASAGNALKQAQRKEGFFP